MKAKMRMTVVGCAALSAALIAGVVGVAAPALAEEPDPSTGADAVVMEKLEALVGTQSDAEIASIVHSSQPAELLIGDTGEVIAAYETEPSLAALSILN